MRLAGLLMALGSAMAAVVFLLLPTSVPLFGNSCGAPAVRVSERVTESEWKSQDFARVCYEQSLPRVFIAGALVLIGVGAGAALVAWDRPPVRREEEVGSRL